MRGAAKLLADALASARRAGATGLLIVRADSAYYGHDIIAAARRAGARFSITARHTPAVIRAITAIRQRNRPLYVYGWVRSGQRCEIVGHRLGLEPARRQS